MTMPGPDGGLLVPRRIDEIRQRQDDSLAVTGPENLTYGELWQRSLTWASAVPPGTVSPGAPIAVLLPRSADLVAAQLACWLRGRPYLPLDPALPDRRIGAVLDAARCGDVLTTPEWTSRLPTTVRARTRTDAVADADAVTFPESEDLAYLIHTSGSTGVPKLVAVTHRSLANLARWQRDTYAVGPGSVCTMLAGLGFDASVWETWSTLASGATLAVPSTSAIFDVSEIARFWARHEVTHSFLSTPLVEELFTSGRPVPDSLRVLLTGGDRLRLWPPAGFGAEVVNLYGPAEATVVTTATGDLRSYRREGRPPIGRPIAGARCEIRDDDGAPVSRPGVPGELWIGGVGVAAGYYGNPTGTAEAFPQDGTSRWYRSGDVCRWDGTGELEFAGRRDRQVKIRGNRLEIAEVEAALLAVPGVRQAFVVLRDDLGPALLLAAYVVGADAPPPARLREQVSTMLPGYMVPTVVTPLDALPLTPNGKVDASRLPAPTFSSTVPSAERSVDDLVETVREVMSRAVGRPVGVDDDFFAVGGHSILAIQVSDELSSRLDRSVEAALVFTELTPRGIAEVLRGLGPDGGTPARTGAAAGSPLPGAVD